MSISRAVGALESCTRAVNRAFAFIAGAIALAIVLIVVREVFFRYVLNAPSLWGADISRFALTYLFFLALAPALQRGDHVSVDLFDPMIPARWRGFVHALGHGLTVIFGGVFFWYILDATIEAFETNDTSFSVLPMPLKYIYWIGPVGTLEFLLTAIVLLARELEGAPPVPSGATLPGH